MEGALKIKNSALDRRPKMIFPRSSRSKTKFTLLLGYWKTFQAELSKPYSQFFLITDDESDEIIASYIVFWVMFDECQILNLGVASAFRRKGFAKKLVMQAIRTAVEKGIRKILLDVRKSNLPAIQLYQSMRFVITHVRKGFYTNGEDAYQMALYLEGDGLDF